MNMELRIQLTRLNDVIRKTTPEDRDFIADLGDLNVSALKQIIDHIEYCSKINTSSIKDNPCEHEIGLVDNVHCKLCGQEIRRYSQK